jgi:hypothetical protein
MGGGPENATGWGGNSATEHSVETADGDGVYLVSKQCSLYPNATNKHQRAQ